MADNTAQLLAELKKQVTQQELIDLIRPVEQQHPKWPNVIVSYMNFLQWVRMEHPELKSAGKVAKLSKSDDLTLGGWKYLINSYGWHRKGFLDQVAAQLDEIWKRRTGKALQAEIGVHAGRRVTIFPYELLKLADAPYNSNTMSDPNRNCPACGYRKRMPVLDNHGEPRQNVGLGTGEGNGAWIGYSPWFWGKDGTSGQHEVGLDKDEVLFHELVHASRLMRGVFNMAKAFPYYQNEEEYIAVVVSNIYLSEKGSSVVRGGHVIGSPVLTPKDQKEFLDNPQNTNPPPRRLLGTFSVFQQDFFDALTRIGPAWPPFNPVREIRAEAYR
jgi:hypothetical protein